MNSNLKGGESMQLLTEELKKRLPALYSQENEKDPIVYIKYFDPVGSWTWYVIEGEQRGRDFLFFGLVIGFVPELGYFTLCQLTTAKVGAKGLQAMPIERDLFFTPARLSKVKERHNLEHGTQIYVMGSDSSPLFLAGSKYKKIGGDEMNNKRIKKDARENFVAREIYANQTSLVEKALQLKIISVSEIYNLYKEFDGLLLSPNICVRCEEEFSCLDSETGLCQICFEAMQVPQVICEWWLVSPWLGKQLLLENEPVIDNCYGIWWGRKTTGQAIFLDYIIVKIYDTVMGL